MSFTQKSQSQELRIRYTILEKRTKEIVH